MRFIYIGDVVGRTGRKAVVENLAELRRRLDLDFVVLNGENAAHGFGITRKICQEFYAAGVDVITTGNHAFDNKDILPALGEDKQFIRPLNLAEGSPGRGAWLYDLADGRKVLVAQVIGRLFMKDYGDPFQAIDKELDGLALGSGADCIIVDFSIGKVESLQICQNLRKNTDFSETILIALLPDDGNPMSFDRSAINETFKKPFDANLLAERLRTLIGAKKELV